MRRDSMRLNIVLIGLAACLCTFSKTVEGVSSPETEPEPDEDDSLDFSDGLYAINAVPLTVLGKGESQLQYNIATQLVNTTLNFGMTTAGDLWVSNAGMLQLYEPVSSVDDLSGLGTVLEGDAYASPLACPSGFVVQDDDTLIFMSQEAYCAQKAGMTISDGSETSTVPIATAAQAPVMSLYPIVAEVGIASPPLACDGIDNPEDIAGKYCLVQRGSCSYQAKYDNCVAAGAVAVVVANTNSELPYIALLTGAPGVPLTMVTATVGAHIHNLTETSNGIVTLTVGIGVPLQGPDYGEPTVAFNIDTGTTDSSVSWPFEYIQFASASSEQVLFATALSPSMTYTVDLTELSPLISGSFEDSGSTEEWLDATIDGASYMVMGMYAGHFMIFDASDVENPTPISTTIVNSTACAPLNTFAVKGSYLYISAFIREPVSESCPGLGGDLGTYPVSIYDLSDPASPVFVDYFGIPELQTYTGASFFFGDGEYEDIAAVAMESSGLVFYDFSDPVSPVAISDVFTVNVTLADNLGYIAGVFSLQTSAFPPVVYGGDGRWYVSVTADGKTGTLYEVSLAI